MKQPRVWVVEQQFSSGRWAPACSAIFGDTAREALHDYRAHNPTKQFRLMIYVPAKAKERAA